MVGRGYSPPCEAENPGNRWPCALRTTRTDGSFFFGAAATKDGDRRQRFGVEMRDEISVVGIGLLPQLSDLDAFHRHRWSQEAYRM